MSLSKLIELAKKSRRNYRFRHGGLVRDWWPKPVITAVPEKFHGNRHTNGTGLVHKYQCTSFSYTGFHTNKKNAEGLPGNLCFTYGECPREAYDLWCYLFSVWNEQKDWEVNR